jgi:hypothetical protein
VRWKCFHIKFSRTEHFPYKIFPYGKFSRKFSAIFFQKIFRLLKSSLNISFFNLFLVALGLGGFESCMCSYLTVGVTSTRHTLQQHRAGRLSPAVSQRLIPYSIPHGPPLADKSLTVFLNRMHKNVILKPLLHLKSTQS